MMIAAPSDGPARPDAYRLMPKSDAASSASATDVRELRPSTTSLPLDASTTPHAITPSAIRVVAASC